MESAKNEKLKAWRIFFPYVIHFTKEWAFLGMKNCSVELRIYQSTYRLIIRGKKNFMLSTKNYVGYT